jgi:hypothetical protein
MRELCGIVAALRLAVADFEFAETRKVEKVEEG